MTTRPSPVPMGALVPLTRPGWTEAGRHLLAGLELAAQEVNDTGGITGRPLELMVRDTAAGPQRAAAAVDELAALGAAAPSGPGSRELCASGWVKRRHLSRSRATTRSPSWPACCVRLVPTRIRPTPGASGSFTPQARTASTDSRVTGSPQWRQTRSTSRAWPQA
jgi:hypothetical protein